MYVLRKYLKRGDLYGLFNIFINRIALEADTSAAMDFYNSEEHAGTSYLPFIGFMLFLAGIVVIIVGLAAYLTAKHNFNIFFDARDVRMTYEEQIMPDDEKARLNNEKLAKDKKKGKIIILIGVVLVIASFVVL